MRKLILDSIMSLMEVGYKILLNSEFMLASILANNSNRFFIYMRGKRLIIDISDEVILTIVLSSIIIGFVVEKWKRYVGYLWVLYSALSGLIIYIIVYYFDYRMMFFYKFDNLMLYGFSFKYLQGGIILFLSNLLLHFIIILKLPKRKPF
ncbi:MAG TPA: hypothetical protein ACFCUD_08230 [Cyclobacteriaceae bacterium]